MIYFQLFSVLPKQSANFCRIWLFLTTLPLLLRLKGYRYTCKPRNFTEQSLDEIQKQVDRVLADRGIAVCVFDTDITRNNPKAFELIEDK